MIVGGLVAVLTAAVLLLVVWRPTRTAPGSGDWTSGAPYAGAAPGAVGLLVRGDGQVHLTGAPAARMWWAASGYDLRLRGDRVEVGAGGRVVDESQVRHRAGELRLLDPAYPEEVLRLREHDPA
ncbi:MAG: hypothetical protein JWO38_2725 [Gemmataceae bacterium]|nr:hypothetical protein [Gemmataceae bacterium]